MQAAHRFASFVERSVRLRLPVVALSVALAACGGGGGGSGGGTPPPTNTAPSVNAGPDLTSARNQTVALNGTAADDGGVTQLTVAWTQTAGTSVALTDANTLNATFTAPDVAADETLSFDLTVTDAAGLSATDTVSVAVLFDVPPTASAGVDQVAEQNSTVTLAGVASDDNPVADLVVAWTQTGGTAVTLSGADTLAPSFTAPPTLGSQQLTFELSVTDASQQTASDTVLVDVFEDLSSATVTGVAEYQFVPFASGSLDYDNQEYRPIRGATIELIDASSNSVLGTAELSAAGEFAFAAPANTDVFLRVRAELKRAGMPGWDVEVRDNTANTSQPLSPATADTRPLYVLDGAPFNSGIGAQAVTLQAPSGWTGADYGNTRASAPFAILDVIYNAIQLVLAADADAQFAPLNAYWSINNSPTVGGNRDEDTGEIGTSFYRGSLDALFLLGEANSDTEEFDTHVIAHEWGHYFEDNFSRSDSVGGAHSLSERLDPRLAFGEGFGNAISAMITGERLYFDTQGVQQSGGFVFDLESNVTNSNTRGWYNERSVQTFLYDVFDAEQDANDALAKGFGPIYDVLVEDQAAGTPFTTIYPFVDSLRARNPADAAAIDAMLASQRIEGMTDAFGTDETEAANQPGLLLPVYTVVTPNGGAANVCSTTIYDPDEDGNKLGVRRFVRIPVTTAGDYVFTIQTSNPPASGQSDPDAFVFRGGVLVGGGDSPDADRETFTISGMTPGDYVMDVYEFSYLRSGPAPIAQPDNRTCFNITVTS